VVVATESGIGSYDDVLFWDHMVQHLMLIMVAPVLLIFGQPITLLLHASRNPLHTWAKRTLRSRVTSFLTWPAFGCVAYAIAIIGAHLTGFANLVESNQVVHNAEHAGFLLIGYLFFLPILGHEPIRWRLSYPVRLAILLLIMPVDTFTGLMLGYAAPGSPGIPAGPRPAWAPSPLQDLHTGGAVMWVGGDGIMFGLMMLVFLMWSTDSRAATSGHGWLEAARRASLGSLVATHAESRAAVGTAAGSAESPPGSGTSPVAGATAATTAASSAPASASIWERRGGIDDDEHLAAYNAFLARLNEAETNRKQ
jgi:cytochrome c oxidase assembly factor CtaG